MDIATHLRLQHGATSSHLLARDGFDTSDVTRAVRRRDLVRVRRGAFIEPAEQPPGRRYVLSCVAVARSRPGQALSHDSALAVLGLPVLRPGDLRFHLLRPGDGPAECPTKDLVVRRGDLPLAPLRPWRDVEAVSPAVAIAQVALSGRLEAAVVAADAAVRSHGLRPADILSAGECLPARRGMRGIERAAALVDPRAESPGETLLRLRLRQLGVLVEPQVDLVDAEGFVGRVDLLDRENRCVYEFDGALKYDGAGGREALVAEKRREDRIRRMGYRVVRVMWRDLELARLRALAEGRLAA